MPHHGHSRVARVITTTLFFFSIASAAASAGPPFVVDDPVPTDYRQYEIYLNSQFSHADGVVFAGGPSLEVNYGLMPNVQFSVSLQFATAHVADGWHAGIGDTEVGAKIRFVQETASHPQVSFYPSVVLPTGNANDGLGEGSPKFFLPLWAQKSFGPWTVFGGGGLRRNGGEDGQNSVFSGVAVERAVTEQFTYGGEVFHETAATRDGAGSTGFNVGFIQALGKTHSVLFSIGRSLQASNALSMYGAYELNLGPKTCGDRGAETPK